MRCEYEVSTTTCDAPTHSDTRFVAISASSAHVMNVCRVEWNDNGRTP